MQIGAIYETPENPLRNNKRYSLLPGKNCNLVHFDIFLFFPRKMSVKRFRFTQFFFYESTKRGKTTQHFAMYSALRSEISSKPVRWYIIVLSFSLFWIASFNAEAESERELRRYTWVESGHACDDNSGEATRKSRLPITVAVAYGILQLKFWIILPLNLKYPATYTTRPL